MSPKSHQTSPLGGIHLKPTFETQTVNLGLFETQTLYLELKSRVSEFLDVALLIWMRRPSVWVCYGFAKELGVWV
jgi:hypothetical protein